MRHRTTGVFSALLFFFWLSASIAWAQTSTTGELAGVVTDPSGAAVPSASVHLRSIDKGVTLAATTNSLGSYRFALLAPGTYEVKVEASNFETITRRIEVGLGQTTNGDVVLSIGAASQTIEVNEQAPLLQTDNGNLVSTISEKQVQNLPNPGNDITYVAQTSPGVVMNTAAGFGNFAANGISGTSNLFTLNGMDNNDPYLNLNNSGATNLTLGQNEVQEVSVVSNGYGGQYNSLAGTNINYSTRSGGNQFHGRALYYWNGSALNANSWFNNNTGTPKSFVNANQWGGDFGGPIIKDKLFGYFNTEGLRVIVPTSVNVIVPSQAFQTATIQNLTANGLTASVPFYQNMFNLYNGAAGAQRATPGLPGDPLGCNGFVGPGGLGTSTACVNSFRSTAGQLTHEALYSTREDWNISSKDRLYGRFQKDHGLQATVTDPINPFFNLQSDQPEYQGQLSETHMFGATAVNQFILSSQWYSAVFNPANPSAALGAFPTTLLFADGSLTTLGGLDFITPQGRNVTQVQFSDDLSKVSGKHTWKFGVKYRRNDVTDLTYGQFTSGLVVTPDLNSFFNGGAGSLLQQNFPTANSQRFKFYTFGGYAEDDWQVKSNLTVTLALRVDHASNPVCKSNCFARLTEPFNQLINDPALNGSNVPYNQILQTGGRSPLTGLTNLEWAPRFGFAWQPLGRSRATVIRGGIGIFWDSFPGQVVDNFSENPPLLQGFTVGGGNQTIAPGENNNLFALAAASNQAFLSGFNSGATLAQLQAQVPGFTPPALSVANPFTHVPQYQKWSLGIEQGLGRNTSVSVTYVGNHGIHELVQEASLNAFQPGFAGLPATAPDPRFGPVNGLYAEGISNYNGVTVSATHRYNSGLIQLNYTWSHALDEVSNGGFSPFITTQFGSTNTAPIFPQIPGDIRGNYGNADYDIRHSLTLNYVWELPFKRLTFGHGPDMLVKGWQVAGTLFVRTGLPFTVVDLDTSNTLAASNYGAATVFATVTGPAQLTCSGPGSNVSNPCFNTSAFQAPTNGFGNLGRNTLRGPGYFNTDFSIMKFVHIPRWERGQFGLGFQFYNIFNHPNFDAPVANLASPQFGTIIRTVSSPTTPFGSGLGGDASPRLIQLKAQFSF